MKAIVPLFCLLLLVSCNAPKAYFDYDENIDFDQFNSYQFYEDMETGLTKLDESRYEAALKSAMQEQNLNESATPDFKVNIYVKSFQKQNNNTIGIGLGAGGGAVGGGVSGGIPIGGVKNYLSLTVEFANADDNELFWQAVVEAKFDPEMNPEERKEFFQEIAEKAIEKYPPKQSKR